MFSFLTQPKIIKAYKKGQNLAERNMPYENPYYFEPGNNAEFAIYSAFRMGYHHFKELQKLL